MITGNKSQFASIEIILLILLFAFSTAYFYKPIDSTLQDYKLNIDSALDTIYYSDDYRSIIMNEDISLSSHTEDWSDINTTLSDFYRNFELILSDDNLSKNIFSCSGDFNTKYYTERVIAIEDNDNFEFRKLRLGVCY